MTHTSAPIAPSPTATALRRPTVQPLLASLARSEWSKTRSVRSTYWALTATGATMIGLGAVITAAHTAGHKGAFDPVSTSLAGVLFAQLAIAVLGVLAITSEYSTGMIRSTFAAAPQRCTVIVAKAVVAGAIAFAVGLVGALAAFLVGQALLGDWGVALSAPGAVRSVVGLGLYLGLLGVFAVGLGTIIRSTAGAITAIFGLLFVLPVAVPALPATIRDTIDRYLPSNAGQAISATVRGTSTLSPWTGLALFALYTAAILTAGLVLVHRRDV